MASRALVLLTLEARIGRPAAAISLSAEYLQISISTVRPPGIPGISAR
jgi:hypothetical protein